MAQGHSGPRDSFSRELRHYDGTSDIIYIAVSLAFLTTREDISEDISMDNLTRRLQELLRPRDRFVYNPLDSQRQEIRVLQVDHRHQHLDEVHLTISHVPFSGVGLSNSEILHSSRERLEYKALSYMCGDQPASARIYMNGKILMVRPNLYAFLRALLNPSARAWFAREDHLWIDALCINQEDLQERSDQVRLMGRIYASARQTLTWLEPEEERLRRPRHFEEDLRGPRPTAASAYWKRLWPCQEIILGAYPLIVDGKSILTIESFTHKSVDEPRNVMQKLALWRKNYPGNEASLLEVIEDFGSRECSDIKDRLFAILSLIRRGADFPVNYADSTSTILWKALHHFQGCYRHTASDDTLEAAILLKMLFNLGRLSRCATLSLDWKCHINMNRLENKPEHFFAGFSHIYICICEICSSVRALVSRIEGRQPHRGDHLLYTLRSLPYPR